MPYSCQFCGEIEESDLVMRCRQCGGEKVARAALGSHCAECGPEGELSPVCPACGSEEVEA